jgi:hypothetical protein
MAKGEALDGETLMLGPVPAWRLPVYQRGTPTRVDTRPVRGEESGRRGAVPGAAPPGSGAPSPAPPLGGAPNATRPRGGVTAALFTRGGHGSHPPGGDDPAAGPARNRPATPAAVEDGPAESPRTEPAQFGWFHPGR